MSTARRQSACRFDPLPTRPHHRHDRQRQLGSPLRLWTPLWLAAHGAGFPLRGGELCGKVRLGTAPDGVLWRGPQEGGIAIMSLEIGHDEVQQLIAAGAYLLDVRERE